MEKFFLVLALFFSLATYAVAADPAQSSGENPAQSSGENPARSSDAKISWKTFDVKVGGFGAIHNDFSLGELGGTLQLVKPFNQFWGFGLVLDAGKTFTTFTTDRDETYDFAEISGGLLLNLNTPIWGRFSFVSNFMAMVNFQDGSVDESHDSYQLETVDGETVTVVDHDHYSNGDYYEESVVFRYNVGVAYRTEGNRFGIEVVPVDYTFGNISSRNSFLVNFVARVF